MTTAPSVRQLLLPVLVMMPTTPNPAPTITAIITPANTAPMPRRSGDCAGSVSRITNAETTRCVMNWYDCNVSRRDAIASSPRAVRPAGSLSDRGESALDRVVDAHDAGGQRYQRHDGDHVEDVGEPAQVRRRGLPRI